MSQNSYTNFQFRHHAVSTVAIYGTNSPTLVSGRLILRHYYKDASCKDVDIPRTNRSILDTIFFETNKLIRIPLEDNYNGRRVLVSTPIPAFGPQYIIAYNVAEIPSERYDDQLAILAPVDKDAHGVAIILKKNKDGLLEWLDRKEAKDIIEKLKG
ncbi:MULTISPECIES: hypothetical protein [Terrabacteria group]|uniref:hypothetical protein n=1 Tax=Bacillati TaxID=1783272 RepID=UPI00193AD14C|nr:MULTISPECIES: hypothetical protein [Terrabacteria group]MBW9212062.1 hypothetical protein [Trueperella sp. zg.1013]QRG87132.1 hypothetical protein JOS54_02150 [Bulleidia sp. zg-1006]